MSIQDIFVVGTARTGAEALRLCEGLDPDLVLLDVHLPDFSGLEVLQRLRADGSTVGVVMVTAERDADAVRTALHGGAMQYLVKPFEYRDFAARMQRVSEALTTLAEGTADQATIDRAFGGPTTGPAPLPKGLSQESARLVEDADGHGFSPQSIRSGSPVNSAVQNVPPTKRRDRSSGRAGRSASR
jgi:response regulator of citrate/malate metabolism